MRGRGIIRTSIAIEKGRIASIGDDVTYDPSLPVVPAGAILLPGFVDEHIHGAGGFDAMDASEQALMGIAETIVAEGTTCFLATTMTQSPENIGKALTAVRETRCKTENVGARLLGVHLEGPFIAAAFRGAQREDYVASPELDVFDSYFAASGDSVKLVTLAPECERAEALIRHLRELRVVASAGHSGALWEDMEKAVAAGLSCVTHTYNAQSGVHHRKFGVTGCAMMMDELYTELICDGIHVSAPAIRLLRKSKQRGKVVLITDAIRAKGLGDGVSELGGQTVYVKGGEARLSDGTLAGSVLRMNEAVRNYMKLSGADFGEAVDAASYNPACNLGLEKEIGSIAVGKRADFTVVNENFEILATVVNGKTVFVKK